MGWTIDAKPWGTTSDSQKTSLFQRKDAGDQVILGIKPQPGAC